MAHNWLQIGLTLAILLVFGTLYALMVRWISNNNIDGQTAYLVAFGVLVTVLSSGALIGLENTIFVLACFAASGAPMIVEYVLRDSLQRKRDRDEAQQAAREMLK